MNLQTEVRMHLAKRMITVKVVANEVNVDVNYFRKLVKEDRSLPKPMQEKLWQYLDQRKINKESILY
ncbi:hypothetical protein [Bacillus cereus]|uniref:hypothetical protein n=1 Tax=Bacillus cereus TaxID=1396 RepID=UPI000976D9CB|nr:hypothetical protein [Bacillus cereus]ONH02512.1 hypothetical protein BKK45_02895 [Bacillus cereus]PFU91675.1 hypothetical protein COK92_18555 [Bacillus anthracis]